MSQNKIPDFTETELWTVRSSLKERYGKEIEVPQADAEVMFGEAAGMAWCSTLFQKPAKSGNDSPDTPNLSPNFWGD